MTVVVAHQSGRASEPVLAAAVSEAALRRVPLHVVHVVTSKDLDTEEALRSGIGDLVTAAARSAGAPDLAWEVHVAAGGSTGVDDTAEAVLGTVDRLSADLLVIGARRRSPVGKAFLGSVTQEILLDSPVPVLVVRAPAS
jgi:nucleotide-binding universal stress UspA family protein